MDEVYELADRVSVLRDGGYVGTLDRRGDQRRRLVRMMVGRDLSSFYKKEHDPHGSRGRRVSRSSDIADGGRRVKPASFELHAGRGARARRAWSAPAAPSLRASSSAPTAQTGGEVALDGKPVDIRTPGDALDAGIVYLTEDRKALGLFLDMSCGDNINLGVIGRDAKLGGVLDLGQGRERAPQARSRRSRIRAREPAGRRSAACPAATSRRCCCRACWRSGRRC